MTQELNADQCTHRCLESTQSQLSLYPMMAGVLTDYILLIVEFCVII